MMRYMPNQPYTTPESRRYVRPAEVAWFQHKIDQTWDKGEIVDLSQTYNTQAYQGSRSSFFRLR